MKRILILLILAALLLAGCSGVEPADDRHPDWPESWFRVHPDLGVEAPEGVAFNESNDVMSMAGLYYATWTAGEGRDITNPQGREAVVYDAQLYVLVKECENSKNAEADVADWLDREKSSYESSDVQTFAAAGQEWRLLTLNAPKQENPYHHGAAAFAVCGGNAISAELLCAEDWEGDPETVLKAFLNGFHYGFSD